MAISSCGCDDEVFPASGAYESAAVEDIEVDDQGMVHRLAAGEARDGAGRPAAGPVPRRRLAGHRSFLHIS
jgi:hypothetical protein